MNSNRESYKRLAILAEVIVLIAVFAGIYGYLWKTYYEDTILIPFFHLGNVAMMIMYPLMLLVLGKVFGVFKVAVASRVDMVFSNIFNLLEQ